MTQPSADHLRELIIAYQEVTTNLNNAIDYATQKNGELAVAKAGVAKYTHSKNLIEEQIRCEKMLIRATEG